MYLMNKVRKLPDKTVYEIVDYSIESPSCIRVCTVDRSGLDKFLSGGPRDFSEENGYLISSAETITVGLFDEQEINIHIGKNLFDLLIELVHKDAFFIPASVFNPNRDYTGEEVSNFSNIRVSSSSMYVGFSLRHNDAWASSKILYVENNKLMSKPFYIALPEDKELETCNLPCVGSAKVNGRQCNYYAYSNELTIVGEFLPALYLPLPLFNYLNLQYSRCLNAFRFFSDIFDQKGILSAEKDYEPPMPMKAITIVSSIKNTSKARRAELSHYYAHYKGSISEFVEDYKLNVLEHYTFSLLSKISSLKSTDDLFGLMKLLKVNRSIYSLALMMLRCQVFVSPEYFFPDHFNRLVARGGGGGDVFTTIIESNNY